MKIYLVRHGEALSKYEDAACPLSPLGIEQAQSVARSLARIPIHVDKIECSTKTRAFQTAQIVAQTLKIEDRLSQRQGLKPNDSPEVLIDELRKTTEDRMLVGHLPFMEIFASKMLTGSSTGLYVNVHPATVICLSGEFDRAFSLEWMIKPEVV